MRRTRAAGAAILLLLTLSAVPCAAQVETSEGVTEQTTAVDLEWPSAREVRRALSEIGWVWVADEYLVWHGGPLPAKDASGQAPVTLQVMEWIEDPAGEPIRVFGGSEVMAVPQDGVWLIRVPLPMTEAFGTWPAGLTSDWTILAEVMELLPLDGITRFEIGRMLNEPGTPRDNLYLPGGAVTFDEGEVQFWKHAEIQSLEE